MGISKKKAMRLGLATLALTGSLPDVERFLSPQEKRIHRMPESKVLAEYELIKAKKSKLPANERRMIKAIAESIQERIEKEAENYHRLKKALEKKD